MYDVAIIGAGPGGYVSAIRAAQYGLKVAVIEAVQAGGTCLNRGCIPTKALLHCAESYEQLKSLKRLGISIDGAVYDYKAMAKFKDTVVKKLTTGVSGLLKSNGVDVINGQAVLKDEHTIIVGDETVSAWNIIIASGSSPSQPPIEGIDLPNVVNSDQVLAMDELPDSVVIIGGGVIGLEFATLFSCLGKKVTILEMLPNILNGMDEDIINTMRQQLQKKGVSIFTSAKVERFTQADEDVSCAYIYEGEEKEVTANLCIVAAGRRPNSADMGLEQLGMEMDRGFIKVDDCYKTSIPNIYAIGDVIGGIQLAHVASSEGLKAVAHIAEKEEYIGHAPSCVYTHPEIACVGMTEQVAIEKGHTVKVGRYDLQGNGRASSMNERIGFAKVVADEKTGTILGAHLVGPNVTEMIYGITSAMDAGITVEQLGNTTFPHPTVSEIIMEACHDVEGLCVHNAVVKCS